MEETFHPYDDNCSKQTTMMLFKNFKLYVIFFICETGRHMEHKKFSWLKKMIQDRVIALDRLILQSNAPVTQFKYGGKRCSTFKDFRNNFLRSELKYLSEESVRLYLTDYYTQEDLKGKNELFSDPRVIHVILELLCGVVDVAPSILAPVLKRNSEEFYSFS